MNANKLSGPWRETAQFPLIVSHRAGGNEAPENTIAALRAARKAGSRVMQVVSPANLHEPRKEPIAAYWPQ